MINVNSPDAFTSGSPYWSAVGVSLRSTHLFPRILQLQERPKKRVRKGRTGLGLDPREMNETGLNLNVFILTD